LCGDCHLVVFPFNKICSLIPTKTITHFVAIPTAPVVEEKPCTPTPCGPNSLCREVGNFPVCSCMPGFQGVPPECRPECVSNSECPPTQACTNNKCRDPCPGTCGFNAQCRVINHNPMCVCPSGYTGDALTHCQIIPSKPSLTNRLIK